METYGIPGEQYKEIPQPEGEDINTFTAPKLLNISTMIKLYKLLGYGTGYVMYVPDMYR